MDGLQAIDRRRNALLARPQLQRKELRVVTRLVQIAAMEPEPFLLRRLPHVALFAPPHGLQCCGCGGQSWPHRTWRIAAISVQAEILETRRVEITVASARATKAMAAQPMPRRSSCAYNGPPIAEPIAWPT